MKKGVLALAVVTLMAFASVTSVFADEPAPSDANQNRTGEFNFLLEVSGMMPDQNTIVGGFKSMSGMDSCTIVLERGYTATDDLWQWRKNIEDGFTSIDPLPPGFEAALRQCETNAISGSVIILDPDLETEVARYNFYEGWPCKWHVPELDSDQSGMAIEKVEIAVEKVERVMR